MPQPYQVEEIHGHDGTSRSAYVTLVGEYPSKVKAKKAYDGLILHNNRMRWGRRFRLIEVVKDDKS